MKLILGEVMEEGDIAFAEESPGTVHLVIGEGRLIDDVGPYWIEAGRDARDRRLGWQEGGASGGHGSEEEDDTGKEGHRPGVCQGKRVESCHGSFLSV
jgi:hypothetical protein